MADGVLGLLFEIAADPSQAEKTIADFNASTGDSLKKAAEGTEPLNEGFKKTGDALVSNQEAARLLSEELGIHLPRAVTGAVAEMLPEIGSLGGGMLAAFAVKEVVEFGKEVGKLADEFNGVANAAKEFKQIGQENLSLMEEAAKKSKDYARSQITLLIAEAAAQEKSADAIRDTEQGLNAMNPILGTIAQAWSFWTGESKELKQAEADLLQTQKARDAMVKILGEDEVKEHKDATEAAKKQAEELKRRLKENADFQKFLLEQRVKLGEQLERQEDERIKRELEAGAKFIAQEAELEAMFDRASVKQGGRWSQYFPKDEDLTNASRAFETLSKNMERVKQHSEELRRIWDRAIESLRNGVPVVDKQTQALLKQIPVAERLRLAFSTLTQEEWQHATIARQVASIIDSSTTQAMESSLASIIGVIGGRKLEAEFNAVYYGAEGAVHLAEGIWPPNPGLIARGLGELAAAAQFAQAAGSGGGGTRGYSGGGGGGGASGRYNTGESSREGSGGGSRGTSAPGGGPSVHYHVYGPAFMGPDDWQQFINTQNQMTQRGVIAPVAMSALTEGARNT